jgi:class 3 adenylate cyclase
LGCVGARSRGLEELAMDVSDSSGVGPAAAERKLVAVLACEVSALTTSRAEPALDQHDRQVADSLSRVEAEVARHGGTVMEAVGGMLVGVFGVPRTHEDDPERAIRTALGGLALGVPGAGRLGQPMSVPG